MGGITRSLIENRNIRSLEDLGAFLNELKDQNGSNGRVRIVRREFGIHFEDVLSETSKA